MTEAIGAVPLPADGTIPPAPANPAARPVAPGRTPLGEFRSRLLDDRGVVFHDVTRDAVEALLRDGRTFWLDLPKGGEEEVTWLRDVFRFHPLAVEDAETFGERPKMEEYDGYATMVIYGSAATIAAKPEPADGDGTIGPGIAPERSGPIPPEAIGALSEVHCFLSETYVVTVHERHCPALGAMLL